jgi:hypothetical protein
MAGEWWTLEYLCKNKPGVSLPTNVRSFPRPAQSKNQDMWLLLRFQETARSLLAWLHDGCRFDKVLVMVMVPPTAAHQHMSTYSQHSIKQGTLIHFVYYTPTDIYASSFAPRQSLEILQVFVVHK